MHDNKYIKTKIENYNDRININFQGNKIPKDNECCPCLSIILLDSVVNIDKEYYPQIILEEYKHAVKKKKIMNTINEELNLDESADESDNDKSNESDESDGDKSNKFDVILLSILR